MIPVQQLYLGKEELVAVGKVFDTRRPGMGLVTSEFDAELFQMG